MNSDSTSIQQLDNDRKTFEEKYTISWWDEIKYTGLILFVLIIFAGGIFVIKQFLSLEFNVFGIFVPYIRVLVFLNLTFSV